MSHAQCRIKQPPLFLNLPSRQAITAYYRTLNKEPKGKGWVQCESAPKGMMCKPEKVLESIEYFKIAYEIYPDIVALNQIALGYDLIGDQLMAKEYFSRMKIQAEDENNDAYIQAAEQGIKRCV